MLCMARARRRSACPSGLDPRRVNRSHFARRSVAAAWPHRAHRLERLEPYEGKLSSTVLRGGRAGNSPPPLDLWLAPISNPRKRASYGRWTNLCFPPSDFSFQPFSFLLRPVEQHALGLLLPGRGLDQAPNEMGSVTRDVGRHVFPHDRANRWSDRIPGGGGRGQMQSS